MKLMPCPRHGERPISEFAWLGEVKTTPAPEASDSLWAEYLYLQDNCRGVVREWWQHLPSGYVFQVERDTVTDRVLATYDPADAPPPDATERQP